jgi:hypothetical protein
MKNRMAFELIFGAAFFCAFIFGCTKQQNSNSNGNANNGCISRNIANTKSTMLSDSQINSINTLFSKNGLSTSQLQFLYFIPDVYLDSAKPVQAQVDANLFINNLPVFNYTEVFVFNNGVFDTAYLYSGVPQNNDTTSHQSLSSLRTAFFKHVSESITYLPLLNSKPVVPSPNTYSDSCLVATMGYVDATYIPGNTSTWGSTLIKVWLVNTQSRSFPDVMVEDDNGLAWGVPTYIP